MPPDPEVLYWSEMGEALAFRDTFQAAAELADDAVGAITSRPGGGVAFAFTKLDIPFFNRAIGVGVARPAVESDVDEVVAFYDGAGRERVGRPDRAARDAARGRRLVRGARLRPQPDVGEDVALARRDPGRDDGPPDRSGSARSGRMTSGGCRSSRHTTSRRSSGRLPAPASARPGWTTTSASTATCPSRRRRCGSRTASPGSASAPRPRSIAAAAASRRCSPAG